MNDCISNSPADMLANTLLSETSSGLWILSGSSGVGKTKFCSELIAQARESGVTVGGILCPAVFKGGKKVGIEQVEVATEKRRRLGTRSNGANRNTVGNWQMDKSVLDWGNQILRELKNKEIIVIDELGPLELEDGRGYQEALHLLDENRYHKALVVVRPSLLPLASLRWPDAQVLSLDGKPMIHVKDLSVSYGATPILRNINLNVRQGEFVLITGPSGCGKSTLAYALSGLLPHSIPAKMTGQVEIGGLDTQSHTLNEIVQQVGIVLQNPSSQLFHLRVDDEIAFGPRNLGLDEDEVGRRTDWALKATGLDKLRERKPSELSGGQKQCVAIASVLAMRPQVLVLDEPTASLDVPSTRRVLDTLKALQDEHGVTIVIVEHRLADVARLANRLVLMNAGQIVTSGLPNSILFDRTLRDEFGLRRFTSEPQVSWEALIETEKQAVSKQEPLLSLDEVSAGYNRNAVIQGINLNMFPGDFIALVGDNGTGKSTLGLVAAGLLKPLSGQVRFRNGDKPKPGLDVAMLFQNPTDQLFTDSVDEEVAFGPRNYNRFDPLQHDDILREADLSYLRERCPLMLSVGQQQRTALSACLGLRPRLLILDEPTLGQDWGHLQRLMNFLSLLNRQGTAILLISHDYKLVHHYARRVFLMKGGHIHLAGQFDGTQNVEMKEGEEYETNNA